MIEQYYKHIERMELKLVITKRRTQNLVRTASNDNKPI